jgi:hypothetical protein
VTGNYLCQGIIRLREGDLYAQTGRESAGSHRRRHSRLRQRSRGSLPRSSCPSRPGRGRSGYAAEQFWPVSRRGWLAA